MEKENLALEYRTERHIPVSGGHMPYNRFITERPDGTTLFTKKYVPDNFSDTLKSSHSRDYLIKEAAILQHVASMGFFSAPQNAQFCHESQALTMEAYDTRSQWHWRAPTGENLHNRYTNDILLAYDQLSRVPAPDDFFDTLLPTHITFYKEGWEAMSEVTHREIQSLSKAFIPHLRHGFEASVTHLLDDLPYLQSIHSRQDPDDTFVLSHHDARQANIAWHPTEGVRLVDWSWAGIGAPGSDATMFLINLAKSGHDIGPWKDHINPQHAHTLLGFYLEHCTWPTRDNSPTVRLHQFASAVAAYHTLLVANH